MGVQAIITGSLWDWRKVKNSSFLRQVLHIKRASFVRIVSGFMESLSRSVFSKVCFPSSSCVRLQELPVLTLRVLLLISNLSLVWALLSYIDLLPVSVSCPMLFQTSVCSQLCVSTAVISTFNVYIVLSCQFILIYLGRHWLVSTLSCEIKMFLKNDCD